MRSRTSTFILYNFTSMSFSILNYPTNSNFASSAVAVGGTLVQLKNSDSVSERAVSCFSNPLYLATKNYTSNDGEVFGLVSLFTGPRCHLFIFVFSSGCVRRSMILNLFSFSFVC